MRCLCFATHICFIWRPVWCLPTDSLQVMSMDEFIVHLSHKLADELSSCVVVQRMAIPSVTWLIDVTAWPLAGCWERCVPPADQSGSSGWTHGEIGGGLVSLTAVTFSLALWNLHNTTSSHLKWVIKSLSHHHVWLWFLYHCRLTTKLSLTKPRQSPIHAAWLLIWSCPDEVCPVDFLANWSLTTLPKFFVRQWQSASGRVKAHHIPVWNCLVMQKTVEAKVQITQN